MQRHSTTAAHYRAILSLTHDTLPTAARDAFAGILADQPAEALAELRQACIAFLQHHDAILAAEKRLAEVA